MKHFLCVNVLFIIFYACMQWEFATPVEQDIQAYLDNKLDNFFSGIYIPSSIKSEVFAGAILVHRNRFMNAKTVAGWREIRRRGIEQVLLVILFQGVNVMTRDYFDFQVSVKQCITRCRTIIGRCRSFISHQP